MEPVAKRNDGNLYSSNTIEPSLVYLVVGMGVMFFLILTIIGVGNRGGHAKDHVFATDPIRSEQISSEPAPASEIGGLTSDAAPSMAP
jgi:hypothetical protein